MFWFSCVTPPEYNHFLQRKIMTWWFFGDGPVDNVNMTTLLSTRRFSFPPASCHSFSNDCVCLRPHEGVYLHICYSAMWARVQLARALTGGRCVQGPLPQPAGHQTPAEEPTTSRLRSPSSRITTWRSDSGCCPSWPPCQTLLPYPLTPSPHISTQSAKIAASECLISIYSCGVSSLLPSRSLNNSQNIQYV